MDRLSGLFPTIPPPKLLEDHLAGEIPTKLYRAWRTLQQHDQEATGSNWKHENHHESSWITKSTSNHLNNRKYQNYK
jgi:hypothetical protein